MKEGHALRDSNLDLRVVRTKTAIRNALVELIEEKGFDAITVKDITTKANINRGTFYAHYQDKFDLMTKCQEDIMYEFSSIAKRDSQKSLRISDRILLLQCRFYLSLLFLNF